MATRRFFVALVLLSLSFSSFAMDLATYKKLKKISPDYAKLYVQGVASGFEWSNTLNESRKVKPLFCSPSKLSLNGDNYFQILEKELAGSSKNAKDTAQIELILFIGLVKTFPC